MTNYQHMCAAATEIQEAWKKLNGDLYYAEAVKKEYLYSIGMQTFRDMVWLPRIEDLIAISGHDGGYWLEAIHLWMDASQPVTVVAEPAKELALKFTMSELYQKTWNGSQWKS